MSRRVRNATTCGLRAHLYAPCERFLHCERPPEMTWVGAPRAATYARQEFAVPGPFLVILATLSAPSIASATMCSMCRCGVTCSENVRDACRTPPDAPLRPDAKRAFPLLPRTLASRFGKISSPAAGPHIPITRWLKHVES